MAERIVHLTTVHKWNDTRIFRKQCQSLSSAGYEVILAAPREQSADECGVRFAPQTRYRWRPARMLLGSLKMLRCALRLEGDIYHFHDPELIGVGLALKLLGKTVIYDVHEIVSQQILAKHWIPAPLRYVTSRCFRAIEQTATRAFDAVVAATPAIARQFPAKKTSLVQNFPIPQELLLESPQSPRRTAGRIAYVGAINRERGVREVVEALEILARADIRLTVAGRISSAKLESELRQMAGWRHVDFVGWCDRPRVANLLAEASMGIVTFLPAPNHIEAQPNKLFEYMAAGLPVIASDFPLWRGIVSEAQCGLLVDPADPQAIAAAISRLLGNPIEAEAMGRRGRQAVLSKFNWDSECDVLLDLYQRLLGSDHQDQVAPNSMRQAA